MKFPPFIVNKLTKLLERKLYGYQLEEFVLRAVIILEPNAKHPLKLCENINNLFQERDINISTPMDEIRETVNYLFKKRRIAIFNSKGEPPTVIITAKGRKFLQDHDLDLTILANRAEQYKGPRL